MKFFKNNAVIKKERQKSLSNHFTLTQPDEEQSSIALAQMGVYSLKFIMFCSFVSVGYFLPFEGLRLALSVAAAIVLGFFVIKFKGIFTERTLVASLNLTDNQLPEAAHVKAAEQFHENRNKTIALWVFSLIVVSLSGYFAAKKYVATSVVEMTESKEKKNNYNAAAYNYNEAVKEGKSSNALKSLAKEMKTAEKALADDKEYVRVTNLNAHAEANSDLYFYAFLAAGIELLAGLFLFQLMNYIETKQFEEFLAEREKNGGSVPFDGNPQPQHSYNDILALIQGVEDRITNKISQNNTVIVDRIIGLQDKLDETSANLKILETKTKNSFKELETETKATVSKMQKQNDLLNGFSNSNGHSVPKL